MEGGAGGGLNLDLLAGSTIAGLLVCDNIFKNTVQDGFEYAAGILIQLDEGSILQATFLRNQCYDDRVRFGGMPTQEYGVIEVVGDDATIDTTYIGNDLRYNMTGPADGLHPGVVTQFNRGFVSESSGAVTFGAGTTVMVAHLLSVTPDAGSIVLTIGSSPGVTDPRPIWVDMIDGTCFRINLTTAISGLVIGWRVRVLPNVV